MNDKTLYLLRHGAAAAATGGGDAERPLTSDGEAHLGRLARFLAGQSVRWDLALCSSALRARATLEALADVSPKAEIAVDERLYMATADGALGLIRQVPEEVSSLLVVGHNPGLRELGLLAAMPGGAHYQRLGRDLPAGGLLSMVVTAATWSGLGPRSAYLDGFTMPADVMDV